MRVYPYRLQINRNLKQSLVPVRDADVYVTSTVSQELKPIYQSTLTEDTVLVEQPMKTDENGLVSFFTTPGRIRIDVKFDAVTTQTIHDVIVDEDIISQPVMNEVPSGTVDDSNTVFALQKIPLDNSIAVYVNGFRWLYVSNDPLGKQFTYDSTTLVLGEAPGNGSILLVDYYPLPGLH